MLRKYFKQIFNHWIFSRTHHVKAQKKKHSPGVLWSCWCQPFLNFTAYTKTWYSWFTFEAVSGQIVILFHFFLFWMYLFSTLHCFDSTCMANPHLNSSLDNCLKLAPLFLQMSCRVIQDHRWSFSCSIFQLLIQTGFGSNRCSFGQKWSFSWWWDLFPWQQESVIAYSFIHWCICPPAPNYGSSLPCCTPLARAGTIQQSLHIISWFFRFLAPAINFYGLLYKVLRNLFVWFVQVLLVTGSGTGLWWLETQFTCLSPRPSLCCLSGSGPIKTKHPNVPMLGRIGGSATVTHRCPTEFGKNRGHVQFSVTAQHGTARRQKYFCFDTRQRDRHPKPICCDLSLV